MLETVATPRTELRLAIARRDAAGQAENDAAKAVVRAKQLVKDAEQNVALLADGDHKIAKFRAAEVKAWTNGGEKPTGELPWHLESLRTFGIEAAARLVEARATYDLLNKELVAASGNLQHQAVAVYRAAAAVLSAEAPALIEDLRQARRTVWALEDKLRSLSAVRFPEADGRSVLIKMPPETFAALNETAPPMLARSVPEPYAIALDRWNSFLQALTQDHEATPEDCSIGGRR
jgi:hypothetical protein